MRRGIITVQHRFNIDIRKKKIYKHNSKDQQVQYPERNVISHQINTPAMPTIRPSIKSCRLVVRTGTAPFPLVAWDVPVATVAQ
jgi:hypothetical protein